MDNLEDHEKNLMALALELLGEIPSLEIYGSKDPARRTALAAFNYPGKSPFELAEALSKLGVEARAGCHCAILAHHYYKLDPSASYRLSFYLYNNLQDVERACRAVKKCLSVI